MTITYFAAVVNEQGRLAQVFVTRRDGRQVSQAWTGVTYRNEREAARDLERLNCGDPR